MLFPLSYSIPAEVIVPYVPFKTTHTAEHNYQFDDVAPYMENYRKAFFGHTSLKCGWDCMRHYEILSQGTITEFTNLEGLPRKTMTNFPKALVFNLNTKYYSLTFDEILKCSSSVVYDDLDSLLRYTRDNLTTESAARYVLRKSGHVDTKRILYLSNADKSGNYMVEMLAHGFSRITEGAADMWPDFEERYDNYPVEPTKKLYGKGFNYTRFLPASWRRAPIASLIQERIKEKYYDVIVHCTSEQSDLQYPFLTGEGNAKEYYDLSDIVLICGNDCDNYWSPEKQWYIRDSHDCPIKCLADRAPIFIRELGN
jgi:hypothetical protein